MATHRKLPKIVLDESNGALVLQHKMERPEDATMRLRICKETCRNPEKRCTCTKTIVQISPYQPILPIMKRKFFGLNIEYPHQDPNTYEMGTILIPVVFTGNRGDGYVIDTCIQTWRENPHLVTASQGGGQQLEDSVNELLLTVGRRVFFYSNVPSGIVRGKQLAKRALRFATGEVALTMAVENRADIQALDVVVNHHTEDIAVMKGQLNRLLQERSSHPNEVSFCDASSVVHLGCDSADVDNEPVVEPVARLRRDSSDEEPVVDITNLLPKPWKGEEDLKPPAKPSSNESKVDFDSFELQSIMDDVRTINLGGIPQVLLDACESDPDYKTSFYKQLDDLSRP